jgi:prepilin peptidase CpaA
MADAHIVALLVGLVATAIGAAWKDFSEQRIPNRLLALSLVYACAVLGSAILQGDAVVLLFVLRVNLFGLFLLGVFMLLPYRYGQVAAGDVKLAMVFGFYLGPMGGVLALLNGALVGGIWALVLSAQQGGLAKAWSNMRLMGRTAWVTGFQQLGWDLSSTGRVTMPYGVALSAGAVSIALWQGWTHFLR